MAVLALDGGVRTQQGESILVVFHLLHSDVPSLDGMALRAIRAHLPLVHVGMTVFAMFANVGKHWFDMALRAFHLFVHAAQWIAGFVVVKLGIWPDRLPSRGSVAIFARDLEASVGTSSRFFLRFRTSGASWLPNKKG